MKKVMPFLWIWQFDVTYSVIADLNTLNLMSIDSLCFVNDDFLHEFSYDFRIEFTNIGVSSYQSKKTVRIEESLILRGNYCV